jgi:hypothetical protein
VLKVFKYITRYILGDVGPGGHVLASTLISEALREFVTRAFNGRRGAGPPVTLQVWENYRLFHR